MVIAVFVNELIYFADLFFEHILVYFNLPQNLLLKLKEAFLYLSH